MFSKEMTKYFDRVVHVDTRGNSVGLVCKVYSKVLAEETPNDIKPFNPDANLQDDLTL